MEKKGIKKASIKKKKKKKLTDEEAILVISRNSNVETWVGEDIVRATWKVNGVQLSSTTDLNSL